jgi:hypothetical protein
VQQSAGPVIAAVVGDRRAHDLGAGPRLASADLLPGLASDPGQAAGGVLELVGLVVQVEPVAALDRLGAAGHKVQHAHVLLDQADLGVSGVGVRRHAGLTSHALEGLADQVGDRLTGGAVQTLPVLAGGQQLQRRPQPSNLTFQPLDLAGERRRVGGGPEPAGQVEPDQPRGLAGRVRAVLAIQVQ